MLRVSTPALIAGCRDVETPLPCRRAGQPSGSFSQRFLHAIEKILHTVAPRAFECRAEGGTHRAVDGLMTPYATSVGRLTPQAIRHTDERVRLRPSQPRRETLCYR